MSRPARRVLELTLVLFLVSLATLLLVDLLPGDPAYAILGQNATPETVSALRSELGLDRSLPVRYVSWVGDALTGDLGTSVRSGRPVTDEILERVPVTLELTVLASVIALAVAVPLGVWSAFRAGSRVDRVTTATSFGLMSLPPFILGILLVFVLALTFGLFPVSGWTRLSDGVAENLRHAFLPAMALALGEIAIYSQLLRADMMATLQEDYVLAARAKGLPMRQVLFRHALRPSLFSLVTLSALNFGRLLGGALIIEQLFGLPGLGRLMIQAIPARDMPVIQGSVLFIAAVYLLLNVLVDISYGRLDPRIRHGER